jgi:hypothetical protein
MPARMHDLPPLPVEPQVMVYRILDLLVETLRLSDSPDRTVEHRPQECRGCHASLATVQIVGHRRQQVVEVMPARLRVIEH